MKYFKNLFLSLKEIFIVMIVQYIILFGIVIIFEINKSIILGSIILAIIQIIYIIFSLKNVKLGTKNRYFPYLLLGISISVIYNMLIFKGGISFSTSDSMPIFLNIICSCIVGPIFEECLFRYRFIGYLKKFNSNKMCIILSSIVFALCHTNLWTIIFAIIIGITCSYFYIKSDNILIPIIIHVGANTISTFLFGYNTWIFIFGILLLFISMLLIKKKI